MAASNFSRHGCGRKHERNAAQKALFKWFACGLLKLGNSCGLQPQRSYFYSLIATALFPLALIKCDLFILIWSLDIKDKVLWSQPEVGWKKTVPVITDPQAGLHLPNHLASVKIQFLQPFSCYNSNPLGSLPFSPCSAPEIGSTSFLLSPN